MNIKSIIGAICACLVVVSFNVNAIPTEADWKVAGDGLITYDANNGLEWLDISYTTSRSYNDISSLFDAGEEFGGWRYATTAEVSDLWTSFGGDGIYNGMSSSNNGLFEIIAPLMGDTKCIELGCSIGMGHTLMLTAFDPNNQFLNGNYWIDVAKMEESEGCHDCTYVSQHDLFDLSYSRFDFDSHSFEFGSALVRTATVPEPPITLLIGSGLLLFGVTRRKLSL